MHQDLRAGKNTTPGIPADADVAVERIYLEYCPSGDMKDFLTWLSGRDRPLEEEDIGLSSTTWDASKMPDAFADPATDEYKYYRNTYIQGKDIMPPVNEMLTECVSNLTR
jgi:hypothetical protein